MNARTVHFVFVMAALGLMALTIGSSVLLRAAVCMLFMLIMALISVIMALYTLRISVSDGKTRVERLGRVSYQISAAFISLFPVGRIVIRMEGAEDMRLSPIPFRKNAAFCEREFPHRGVFPAFSANVYVEDMFGLFRFSRTLEKSKAVITVTPRIRKVEEIVLEMGETGPEAARRFPDDSNSPSGVREWRDGDLLKRIHWKLTMKMYDPTLRNLKPMVRTYDEAARPDVIVIPDLMRLDAVDQRARRIEDAVCELAMGVIAEQLETDNPVRMLLGGKSPVEVEGSGPYDTGAFAQALAECLFDSEQPYEEMLAEAMRRLDRTGAVILITSRLTLRAADAAIRLRKMTGICVAVIWITDTRRTDAETLTSRMESSDVIVRRVNPFRDEDK